jgi:hypothetical protein
VLPQEKLALKVSSWIAPFMIALLSAETSANQAILYFEPSASSRLAMFFRDSNTKMGTKERIFAPTTRTIPFWFLVYLYG